MIFKTPELMPRISIKALILSNLAFWGFAVAGVIITTILGLTGAGLMALVGAGHLAVDDVEGLWSPGFVAHPSLSDGERSLAREQWAESVERAARTIPELSEVSF